MVSFNNAFWLRRFVQFGFLLILLFIGIRFSLFVQQLEAGAETVVSRPPSVDGFLPISSLMALKYWVLSGDFPMMHPSGLLILLFILLTAVLLKRGFCSWVCPVGLLNEGLTKIHALVFEKPRQVRKWIDYPLRGIKYLILLFFAWTILGMDTPTLQAFLNSPFNKTADIKMLYFFTEATPLTIQVLIGLLVLSLLLRNFWCRYLCPYGALLGATSWFSVFKIRRNAETCTDCKKCSRVCPVNIKVHKAGTVMSDECHACLQCTMVCPVKDTLQLSAPKRKGPMKPLAYAGIIVGLFLFGSLAARLGGIWQNDIPMEEYRHLIRFVHPYDHAHGRPMNTTGNPGRPVRTAPRRR